MAASTDPTAAVTDPQDLVAQEQVAQDLISLGNLHQCSPFGIECRCDPTVCGFYSDPTSSTAAQPVLNHAARHNVPVQVAYSATAFCRQMIDEVKVLQETEDIANYIIEERLGYSCGGCGHSSPTRALYRAHCQRRVAKQRQTKTTTTRTSRPKSLPPFQRPMCTFLPDTCARIPVYRTKRGFWVDDHRMKAITAARRRRIPTTESNDVDDDDGGNAGTVDDDGGDDGVRTDDEGDNEGAAAAEAEATAASPRSSSNNNNNGEEEEEEEQEPSNNGDDSAAEEGGAVADAEVVLDDEPDDAAAFDVVTVVLLDDSDDEPAEVMTAATDEGGRRSVDGRGVAAAAAGDEGVVRSNRVVEGRTIEEPTGRNAQRSLREDVNIGCLGIRTRPGQRRRKRGHGSESTTTKGPKRRSYEAEPEGAPLVLG